MPPKPRVLKSPKRRISECETHLYFLWEARQRYRNEEDRYKQVATELRVLIGDHRPKRRLLLDLMAEHKFPYQVEPPGPPFDHKPIPTVGSRSEPEHQALVEDVAAAMGDDAKLAQLLSRQAVARRAMPFDEYVDRALAVYIAPYDYSCRELVVAIAQQLGSSHEDTAVDMPLAQMEHVPIGGQLGYVAPLMAFADLVLHVGSLFIQHVARTRDYKPKYFTGRAV